MYSRPIKIYQGIDNPIQIVVKNQDQKAVDLTGYVLQVDIQDPLNETTAYSYAVTFSNISLGRGTFTISNADATSLDQRIYKLTVKTILESDSSESPLYVDDNYTAPLDLQVLPGYYATTEPAPTINEAVIDSGTLP